MKGSANAYDKTSEKEVDKMIADKSFEIESNKQKLSQDQKEEIQIVQRNQKSIRHDTQLPGTKINQIKSKD